MKPVTMYECPHCKKLFRTPNRHKVCKFDPARKNCFSCKHNKGFNEEWDNDGFRDIRSVIVDCEKVSPDNYECIINTMYHGVPKWELTCHHWEGK